MRLYSPARLLARVVPTLVLALLLACSVGATAAPAEPGKSQNAAAQAADMGKADEKGAKPVAKPTAPVAKPTAVYVMRGRVVQMIRPGAAAVGSLSFRITSSNRLATQLRGMVVTVALAAPVRVARGTAVVVRLRAPVDVLSRGFTEATTIRVTPTA